MPDRYLSFDRDDWALLRAATPMTLSEDDLDSLRGINERIDLDDVAAVYLPLSRLLNLYVSATQDLHKVSATFLGTIAPKVPYVEPRTVNVVAPTASQFPTARTLSWSRDVVAGRWE